MEAKDHKIWLGMQKGLLCYDPESGKYEMFTVKQGLPDNIVQAVVEDENGGIWCSTAQGIAHIASGTRKVTSYYTGNGLEDKVYLSGCRAQCKSGTIYFGGEKGLLVSIRMTFVQSDRTRLLVLRRCLSVTRK